MRSNRPKPARSADPGRVTNAVRREVAERDEHRCAYVDAQGKRCNARAFLQHDHKTPRGLGGGSEADNVRYLCALHNGLEAERIYGRRHIERAIAKRRRDGNRIGARARAPDENTATAVANNDGAAMSRIE